MAFHFFGISTARISGTAAYAGSFLVCFARWVKCRRVGRPGALFAVLAGAQLALLLDFALNLRWRLHDLLAREAVMQGDYDLRRAPQLLALVILAVVTLCGVAWIVGRLRRRAGVAIATTATMLSLALWCSEVLSYHFFDQVLYHAVGAMMLVSVVRICLILLTCVGAWVDGWD